MRVLVQHRSTLQYLHACEEWTPHELDALDFQKTVKAIEYCVRERVADVQVVLKFGPDKQLDIVLPVRAPSLAAERARLSAA